MLKRKGAKDSDKESKQVTQVSRRDRATPHNLLNLPNPGSESKRKSEKRAKRNLWGWANFANYVTSRGPCATSELLVSSPVTCLSLLFAPFRFLL